MNRQRRNGALDRFRRLADEQAKQKQGIMIPEVIQREILAGPERFQFERRDGLMVLIRDGEDYAEFVIWGQP